jgi:carbonic anhydrase/acetyltransferase-like protein (isoleucine patch superfamily)
MVVTHNPTSQHLKDEKVPNVSTSAFIHPQAFVCGNVHLGREVFVAPFASVRADEGSPFFIDDETNIQDGVVLHALETFHDDGRPADKNLVEYNGKKYSIFIGKRVSLAHQSQVHGPALIEDDTFVGMQAFVFKSRIGSGCVVEPGAKVIGVTVPTGRYVPTGMILNDQADADALPEITEDYPLVGLNKDVVKVNRELARTYNR